MNPSTEQKIIDLETALGLLQHDFEQQNEMLLVDARRIDRLEQAVARLSAQLTQLREAPLQNRTPEEERPPHY